MSADKDAAAAEVRTTVTEIVERADLYTSLGFDDPGGERAQSRAEALDAIARIDGHQRRKAEAPARRAAIAEGCLALARDRCPSSKGIDTGPRSAMYQAIVRDREKAELVGRLGVGKWLKP